MLKLEYNILKYATSLTGFKHIEATVELMCVSSLNRKYTEKTKSKIAANSHQAQAVIVTKDITDDNKEFLSIRKLQKL